MHVGVKVIREGATAPTYGTELSACADIRASLSGTIKAIDLAGNTHTWVQPERESFVLEPGDRALIPTGLIFDIPAGHSLRVHPRSGLSYKSGLTVVCGEGVIDEDYQNELFVPVINLSGIPVTIYDGDRIAQIELVKDLRTSFEYVEELSDKDSTRNGGFGHTGTS